MSSRLDRLEAENDSLRAAVGVLLNQLSGERTEPAADTAVALLDAGREQVQHWGVRIFISLVFLGLVALLVRATGWLLDRLAERNAARRLFFKRVVPIARIFLWTVALLFVAMVIMEVDAQGLLAAGAAVGVAVGFAAQDILKNVFGGLIVLFDQPFQVGDKIRVGGTYGEVTAIGLRSTRITTPDDNMVSVPNSQVVGDQVSNANAGALNCQVVTDLFLPGDVDEALAKRIAFEAAAGSRYLFRNKPIVVLVKSMFEHTFHTRIRVKAYVLDPRLEFNFESDVTERARAGFREAGIPLVVWPPAAGEGAGVWSADEVAP
jgi:small-conductance mechanosensitive channel